MAIKQRGEKTYLIRVYLRRDPLTHKRLEINETYHGTFSGAQKREVILIGRRHSGQIVKSSKMTVNQLISLFLDSTRYYHSYITRFNYKQKFQMYVSPYIGTSKIRKLKTSDFQKLFNFLLDPKEEKNKKGKKHKEQTSYERGLSIARVRAIKQLIHTTLNFAVNEKLLSENPVSYVKLPVNTNSAVSVLTLEEILAFIAIKELYRYGNAFVFQLHTGLRNQELLGLIWDDIDFERGTVRVERACKWIIDKFR